VENLVNITLLIARMRNGHIKDPYLANVVAGLHMDGTNGGTSFPDINGKTWTGVGVTTSTAQSKFGGASMATNDNGLGTSGNYLSTPHSSDFDFGSGDFTIEGWVNYQSYSNNTRGIVANDNIGGNRGWLMYLGNGSSGTQLGGLAFSAWIGGTSFLVADTVALPTSTQVFWTACRDGGTLRLYKNGVQVASAAITGSINTGADQRCVIGNLWQSGAVSSNGGLPGYIDDLRITKGVCRYTGGGTFPVPSRAFSNI